MKMLSYLTAVPVLFRASRLLSDKLSSLVIILGNLPRVSILRLSFMGVHPWIMVPGYQSYFELLESCKVFYKVQVV